MKTRRLLAGCALLLAAIGDTPLLACGDKILVPTRGTRFDLTPSTRRQAAVLVYMNPASSLPALFNRLSLEPALKKVGYQLTIVDNYQALDERLQKERWDVVLVSLGEIPLGAAPRALDTHAVLAVAVNATKAELKQAKGQYSGILKSPNRSTVVEAFDAAVAASNDSKRKSAKKLSQSGQTTQESL